MDGGRQGEPNPNDSPLGAEMASAIVVDNSTLWGTYMVTVAGQYLLGITTTAAVIIVACPFSIRQP